MERSPTTQRHLCIFFSLLDTETEKLMNALLKPELVAKEEIQIKEKALEVVDFLNLSHLKNELAGNLSGGQKNY